MKNSLFKRISRIVAANVETILSSVENQTPVAILEEAIKDVNVVIDDVREELAGVVTNKHLATKELTSKNNLHDNLSEQIQLAVDSGKEQLAESGIAEQLDIEAQIPILEKTILDCQEEEKQLESYIQALKAKINEMRMKIQSLSEISKEQSSIQSAHSDHNKKLEEAERAFNKVFQSALSEKNLNPKNLDHQADLKELEELERKNRVQERLHSFKRKS